MKDQVLQRMDELACVASLRGLIEQLPDDVGVIVKPGRAEWLPLAAADGCVAGIYMNVLHLWLLLTPTQARQVHDATGSRMSPKNPTTWYIYVSADEASDPARAPLYADAVVTALRRSATRVGSETPDSEPPNVGGSRRQRVCPEDWQLVPASGICETHGADCG